MGALAGLLVAFAIVPFALYPLVRRFGPAMFGVAAILPLLGALYVASLRPTVLAGVVYEERVTWIPQLGFELSLRVDALSWVMSLIVLVVGALVLLYCTRYFGRDEAGLARFGALFVGFAGAMLGLVLADDLYLLFVFWEATTVFSYFLIGHYTGRRTSRNSAMTALLVTTFGGLTMFVGFVIVSVAAGTSQISALLARPPQGEVVTVAVILILVGAISKSALFPMHFWLPAAMAAPTPVSAYLHAAAMVKAGIYLVARLGPGFAETPGWQVTLVLLGGFTMLLGGVRAMRQFDLKLVLAHGTVSQLGFLMMIMAFGTFNTALAALTLLIAHALFKAVLFLIVGVIDHRAGTRDLRKLSGLGAQIPMVTVLAVIAAASMAGIVPMLGFVAKEAVFSSLLDEVASGNVLGIVALIIAVLGSILTVGYAARFLWGAFGRKVGVPDSGIVHQQHNDILVAPTILTIGTVLFGLAPQLIEPAVRAYASSYPLPAHPYHLALWHGFNLPLAISAFVVVGGAALFFMREQLNARVPHLPERFEASHVYWVILRAVDVLATRITRVTQRGSLPFYLGVILIVFITADAVTISQNQSWPVEWEFQQNGGHLEIAIAMITAALATMFARKRFQAVVLVGVTGYGMAALFALNGAPDLALTQALVETVTLIAFVLVIRRLPPRFGEHRTSWRGRRTVRVLIGAGVGLSMALIAVVALGARVFEPVSVELPFLAYTGGHGSNVVNVTLVDVRGWDTMGELSVIIAAATGVASLVFLRTRQDNLPRISRRDAQVRVREHLRKVADPNDATERGTWLLAGRSLAPKNRSIILEVVVRLIFHALIIISIYLLLVGHNAPGGGFVGGLVAGIAFAARYLAGGREELGASVPFDAGKLLGVGLALAVGTALVPLFFGADALTSTWLDLDLGAFGEISFVTSTIFDIGVYLVVIGLILDVLRSLGAQIDRDQELEREGVQS